MNSTDLPDLLTAPTVSRAAFFAQLSAAPNPPGETSADEQNDSSTPEPPAQHAAPVQPAATGFPA